jgi:hypothetical protein
LNSVRRSDVVVGPGVAAAVKGVEHFVAPRGVVNALALEPFTTRHPIRFAFPMLLTPLLVDVLAVKELAPESCVANPSSVFPLALFRLNRLADESAARTKPASPLSLEEFAQTELRGD